MKVRHTIILSALALSVSGCIPTENEATCTDGQKNDVETDVDCGGACGKCVLGKACLFDRDCESDFCDQGLCSPAGSCKELKRNGTHGSDGVYDIDPDKLGPKPSIKVYCDMTTDGGGWTLVGRSGAGDANRQCVTWPAAENFGWRSGTGSVEDDAQPYSLNAWEKGIQFTEMLWGEYTSGKTWGTNLFKATVPADFIAAQEKTLMAIDSGTATVVAGPCYRQTIMFHNAGFTETYDGFWFRDNQDRLGFGLAPTGFYTCFNDCKGGNLNGKPGMIFVR